jgi:hypothetical protein
MASTGKSSQIQCRKCGGLGHFARDCASSCVMIALEDGGYNSASDYDEKILWLLLHLMSNVLQHPRSKILNIWLQNMRRNTQV